MLSPNLALMVRGMSDRFFSDVRMLQKSIPRDSTDIQAQRSLKKYQQQKFYCDVEEKHHQLLIGDSTAASTLPRFNTSDLSFFFLLLRRHSCFNERLRTLAHFQCGPNSDHESSFFSSSSREPAGYNYLRVGDESSQPIEVVLRPIFSL
ncbi:hypothetical protein J6590_068515 [Homalodisca vitripennis]|nr:hypothetical protein J6590_068515 [Homalodisca vitripennis]